MMIVKVVLARIRIMYYGRRPNIPISSVFTIHPSI